MLRNRTAVMLFFIGRKRKLRYFSVLTDSNTQRVRENIIEKALDRETGDFVCRSCSINTGDAWLPTTAEEGESFESYEQLQITIISCPYEPKDMY